MKNITLFWGDRTNPWSFGNEIEIPESYKEIDMHGLVDEDSRAITEKISNGFLKMKKVDGKSVPVSILVPEEIAEQTEKNILKQKYGDEFQKVKLWITGSRGEYELSVKKEYWKDGEITETLQYDVSDPDEAYNTIAECGLEFIFDETDDLDGYTTTVYLK